jgi:formate-dependent nitrite reductase membrane component NrfD
MVTKSVSGNLVSRVEAGVSTGSGSGTLAVDVITKKESNKKATSHIAVMSIFVLFFDIFTFAIFF